MKSTISLDDVLSGKVKLPKGLILDNSNGVTTLRIDGSVGIDRKVQAGIDDFMYELNGETPDETPKEHKVRDYLSHSLKNIHTGYVKLAEILKTYRKKP